MRTRSNAIFILAVVTTACASRAAAPDGPAPDALYRLLLNREVIQVGNESVLDLLNNRYGGNVAHRYASTPQDQPLVLLDRVRLEGVHRLADVPALHAASIDLLRPTEATSLFGPRAKHGAIVVITKRGRSP